MNGQSINGLNNNLMNEHANLNGMCMNNLLSNGLINTNSMASLHQHQQQQQHYHHSIHNEQLILSPKLSDNNKKDDIIEKAR